MFAGMIVLQAAGCAARSCMLGSFLGTKGGRKRKGRFSLVLTGGKRKN